MRLLCCVLTAVVMSFAVNAGINIGEKIKAFPSPVWLDGQNRAMTDFLKDKKVSVLYFWRADQHSLSDFSRIAGVAEKFRSQVSFAGIAPGSAEKLKRFPGAMRLGFPSNADENGEILEKWGLKSARLPQVWVVDSNGTLLWKGRSFQLPGVLNQCLDGKFDLQNAIRKERFSQAVNGAVKAGEFEKAASMLHQEWLKNTSSAELLEAQVALLTRRLKRPEDAFKLLQLAQQKNPGSIRFYELEYKLLADPAQSKHLPGFFQRVLKEFAGKPAILMAFAAAEMSRPAEQLNMGRVLLLADTGWRSHSFENPEARGRFALEYAKIVHAAGRLDLACQLAGMAYKLLKSDPKLQQGAKEAALYYNKMKLVSPAIKVENLQK